jgi:hypothetical protein
VEERDRKLISLNGLTAKAFKASKPSEQRKYLKDHPHSKYWAIYNKSHKKIKLGEPKKNHAVIDATMDDKQIDKAALEFAANNEELLKVEGVEDSQVEQAISDKVEDELGEEESRKALRKELIKNIAKAFISAGAFLLLGYSSSTENLADKYSEKELDTVLPFSKWKDREYPDGIEEGSETLVNEEYKKYLSGSKDVTPATKRKFLEEQAKEFALYVKKHGADKLKREAENLQKLRASE